GTIAARAVAESEGDGHTLLLGNTSTLVISPLIYRNIGYDPLKAFSPIARIGVTSNLLIAASGFNVKTAQDIIDYAKANPGKLNYASAGVGTPPHLIGEMFKLRAGIEVVHIPYKGGGPSLQAVIAGEAQFSFENSATSLPAAQAGLVRPIAVTGETRSVQGPDGPTMIESGFAGLVSGSFTRLGGAGAQRAGGGGRGGAGRHAGGGGRAAQRRREQEPEVAGDRCRAGQAGGRREERDARRVRHVPGERTRATRTDREGGRGRRGVVIFSCQTA